MTVLLPFIVNAGLNFVLGLLVALFLGPEAFGLYAIGAATVVLVNTALLDWLKLSAVRFYSVETRESDPGIRATLDLLFAGVSLSLCALLAAAMLAGVDAGLPAALLMVSVAGGIAAGWFDYHAAIARARFLDAAYARLVLVRSVAALLLMVGGAWWTRDPAVVLLGGVLSALAAVIANRSRLADMKPAPGALRADLMRGFARYALPLVAGNAVYAAIPLLNRAILADRLGFAEAGYFSLASDIGLRLFPVLASMLEIVLLREVIRLDETRGTVAAQKRIARNMVPVLACVLPVALGFWLILPAFERLFVPASFRGHFAGHMALLLPGFAAIALFQAGLAPVFLLAKRTLVAILTSLIGLAVNLAIIFALPGTLTPATVSIAQSAAYLTALLVMAVFALRALPVLPPLREIACVLAAGIAMGLAIWPLRGTLAAALELPLQIVLGGLVYAVVILACDVGRWRTGLKLRWLARRSARR
ncbi:MULTISPECIES: lipopolysaccharide biosynthesis protein [Bosea]|uniref:lipopolysaccharide biosynthesis protein n=1 Tax=Bosea TaxID=85413 RepID=UPI0021500AF7|nr:MULTISPECIES: polysaccharide biosynthesis C-terminal domain-containing protein [Bosea]MCR4524400.1 lipopolysaccharide biosynthesis protein [Bosea sp. 47.2.35]MDR6826900.1 O-antigen/teichoic acid export membrane protein [Bosea robiniae]MDR6893610.1 O-antigen/teichoic acid export membrane protein [Bosea sp. BE109]MDR7136691.1 O-antigen/teichoic acid export membrane protein [Bosea sp. BE168]MDR7173390.1 O-antigen/teichoic acid export membrane protein [Bosea sp. BE271]